MGNEEQRERWDGDLGQHWVEEAERYDRLNERFGDRVRQAVDVRPGERVLDVGCGNGRLSVDLARDARPDGEVVGIDLSGPMLEVARQRADAEGSANVRFEQLDAQDASLGVEVYDAVVSRFGVMFFDEPTVAFSNLRRSLRPGGRLAFVCWQELFDNEWISVPTVAALAHVPAPELGDEAHAPGPFALADPQRVRDILTTAGFSVIDTVDIREPMHVADSADDAIEFFGRTEFAAALFGDVDDERAAAGWAAVRRELDSRATPEGIVLHGAAWLVTARRG